MIRAGTVSEISVSSGEWIILDIGFSNKSKSCGLLINLESPVEVQFCDAKERIVRFISTSKQPVNLMIEAPLSVVFDENGNPKGRSIDKQGNKNRPWYVGPGCSVMVAALYLMKALTELEINTDIRLFEGFVSFKEKEKRSDHSKDVLLLREVVEDPNYFSDSIIKPEVLRKDPSDTLESAFQVAGMDFGIPPVIIRNG